MSYFGCPCGRECWSQADTADHAWERHGRYVCGMCVKIYSSIKNLQKHNEREGHDLDYPCSFCSASFSTTWELNHHSEIAHPNNHPVTCSICDGEFASQGALQEHLDNFHWTCDVCDHETFTHSDIHAHQKEYNHCFCQMCNLAFQDSDDFEDHRRTHSRIEQRCLLCNILFNTPGALHRHFNTVDHPVLNLNDLTAAEKLIAKMEDSHLYCQRCERTFVEIGALEQHRTSMQHAHLRHKICPLTPGCGRLFPTNSSWIQHKAAGKCRQTLALPVSNPIGPQSTAAKSTTSNPVSQKPVPAVSVKVQPNAPKASSPESAAHKQTPLEAAIPRSTPNIDPAPSDKQSGARSSQASSIKSHKHTQTITPDPEHSARIDSPVGNLLPAANNLRVVAPEGISPAQTSDLSLGSETQSVSQPTKATVHNQDSSKIQPESELKLKKTRGIATTASSDVHSAVGPDLSVFEAEKHQDDAMDSFTLQFAKLELSDYSPAAPRRLPSQSFEELAAKSRPLQVNSDPRLWVHR